MAAAPIPADESKRLRSLVELGVLDSAPEREFDALVQAAALVCGVPISLISLIDADRQWFKANVGLPGVKETPRELAFCAHAILEDGIFEVPDASLDSRFLKNELVTGNPSIRFYAGATLRLHDGSHAGTLCVIDQQPRKLDAKQREVLSHLAAAAVLALEGRRALLAEREMRQAALEAAAVLSESEARFKALSEVSPLGVFAIDARGACIYTNGRWQSIYALTLAQSLGNGWLATVHPDDREAVIIEWQRTADLGVEFDMQFRILRTQCADGADCTEGQTRTVRSRARGNRSVDGSLIGYVGSVEDITERLATNAQLVVSEQRLRDLYESTPAMLHSMDPQGRLLSVTGHWLDIMGYCREQVIGRLASDFLTETSRANSMSLLSELLARGRVDDVPHQMICKNGSLIDVLLSAVVERDAAGHPLRSMAVVKNITERLRAQRALSDERARLASIIEGTGASTWEWNVQTGEMRVNEQWATSIGYTLDQLGDITFQTLVNHAHPDDLKLANASLQRHFSGELLGYECEARLRHRDGHWVWVVARGRVLTWLPDGKPEWMFGTNMDVSERKRQNEALRKSEQLLNRTGEVAGVGGWEVDLVNNTVTWSTQTRRIHGVTADYTPVLADAINFFAPEARAVLKAAAEHAVATGEAWDLELPLITAAGQQIWVHAVGQAEFEDGRPVRLVGALQDITALRSVTAELAAQHELTRVTLQSIADAVITTDASGNVTWLNSVAERMTGWINAQAKGQPVEQVFNIVDEATRAAAENPVARCLQQKDSASLTGQSVLISRRGGEFGIDDSASPIRNDRGEILGVVLVFRDVTEQRRLSGEMSYRATHDALTGLVNRAEFEARLRRSLSKAQEERSAHALLFIDLDQFKLVNDACGHSVGDQLLQQVSKLFGETVRARDTLARLGGDEFAVILEHCSMDQAQRVAQQICDRMDDFRFIQGERRFRIGASIGLVPVDNRWSDTAQIIQAADTSCYAAKEAGRNRVHAWYDTSQARHARQEKSQWAARLERALDENRFKLFAQHMHALAAQTQGLHVEVLLRMIESDGTVVLPEAFLPSAERFNLASRIDLWVLRQVTAALASLANLAGVHTLCVNLSGSSVGDRAFHRETIDILTAAGSETCRRLCFDIKETTVLANLVDASAFIDQVRALGVRIAMDDFGATASSFGYLKNLQVDLLKIDGQFIRDMIDDPLDDAAVRGFVEVARVVGAKTVAESVERADVLARARTVGIDFAQGFFLHRPEPIAMVLGLPSAGADVAQTFSVQPNLLVG